MPRLSRQDLDALRSSVRPELASLPDEAIEQTIESALTGMSESTAEDFLKALSSIAKEAGPALQRAAPSIAQGAATGATVGGPWGALVGAGAGLASGVLGSRRQAAVQPASAASSSVPAGAPRTAGVSEPLVLPAGQGAAATVLGLLQNPIVKNALTSQAMGASGKQQIPLTAGTSVPRAAINSLLTQLLEKATEGLVESELMSEQSYLKGENGELLVDPASPEQQAALVLSHISASTTRPRSDTGESVDGGESIREAEFSAEDLAEGWLASEEIVETVRFY